MKLEPYYQMKLIVMVIQFISMILMNCEGFDVPDDREYPLQVSITITHHEVITAGDVLIFKDIQELDITMNDLMVQYKCCSKII